MRPVQAVIPGTQGRILAVLAETTAELNLRTIARLADVSPAQASRVLPELVRLGMVERREAPPSALFRLVEENLASQLVRSLSRVRDATLNELSRQAKEIIPAAISIIVFGSFARGEAIAESDLDLVVVRPSGISEDDNVWAAAVEEWRRYAVRMTGNQVEILEVDIDSIGRLLRGRSALWNDIIRDGVVITGAPLDELRGQLSA